MKRFFLLALLFLFFIPGAVAQTGQVFHLNKLSKDDTLLNGWKVHTGDNAQWAQSGFDDSKWQATDPAQDITEFKPIHETGVCWLRLHIQIDSNLRYKQLAAWVFQCTASEIYMDGQLIKKFGTTGKTSAETVAISPVGDLFDITFEYGRVHVIAVRLGYESGFPYTSPMFTPLSAFCLYVNDYHSAQENVQQTNNFTLKVLTICGAFSGALFIISLIYLFYYFFYRQQKVNLYYSISCAFFFLLDLSLTVFLSNIQLLSTQMWVAYAIAILFVCSSISMVLTIYILFEYKKKTVFVAVVMIGIAALGYNLLNDIMGFVAASNVYMALCMIEGIRVSRWAIKLHKTGSEIIFWGLISVLVLNIWSASMPQANILSIVTGLLATLGFPLGMSIYLAIQNAMTYQTLGSTLSKIQLLSEQNLIKEQEKQQILADQNTLLETQVNERTAALNQSITHLKATQTQLIQSEKMASLGELTAGIAHEIQNPLNFVNNFSEVNQEMLVELDEELSKGDISEAKLIAADIRENEAKINHHGRRADRIVKGMLEHSRVGTGEKQLVDLNTLADEFLKLSFHGLRAKDKSLSAVPIAIGMITHFDQDLPKVNVSQRDMGRVMLNLFNNAFYAVNQKAKTAGASYKPEVSVATLLKNDLVMIIVKDNGNGIPDTIKDKIMQPFFTTKPTGEGTGLGLSLSYDIVVKGHGGSIQVSSVEGEASEFIVKIPVG